MQNERTGSTNQLWVPVASGQGIFKIRSVLAPSMFLSVMDDSVEDGGRLQISDHESPSQYWRIEGYIPPV